MSIKEKLLRLPQVYSLWTALVGAGKLRKIYARDFLKISEFATANTGGGGD